MSIADKLVTIAENEQRVYKAGQLNVLANAESLNGSLSGEAVSANDVSSVEHNVPCRLENKNLFEFKHVESISNVTIIEKLENGAIVQGNYAENDNPNAWSNGWYSTRKVSTVALKAGDVVTLSCDYTVLELNENRTMEDFPMYTKNKVGLYLQSSGSNHYLYPTNQPKILGETLRMSVTATITVDGEYYPTMTVNSNKVRIENIQIEYGSTATEYTPYITDFSQVEVTRYGKNIFDDTKIKSGFAPQSGAYPISNSSYPNSQYFELNVYAGQTIYFSVKDGEYNQGRVRYALNGEVLGPITKGDNLGYLTASESQNNSFDNSCFQIKKDCTLVFIFLEGLVDIQMQIEYGNKQTDYEPCKKQIYTSTTEGVVNGITSIAPSMTLLTDTEGVVINANYYKDPDIVISNLAQSVALSGGEG